MPRLYKYRKHIRWAQYAFPLGFAMMAVTMLVTCLSLISSVEPTFKLLLLLYCGVFSFTLLSAGGVLWYLYYRLAGIEVSIQDGAVVYKTRSGVDILPLEEISCLKFPSIKYVGGWIRIVTPRNSIRLTVVVEGIDQFLLELKAALDAHGLSVRYDRGRYFQFLKTAAFSDQSWDRVYRIWGRLLLIALFSAAWGYMCAIIADVGELALLIPGIFASVSVLPYMGAELCLGRYFAKAAVEESFSYPASDPGFEDRIYLKAAAFWGAICLLVLVGAVLIRM